MKRVMILIFVAAIVAGSWFLLVRTQAEVVAERPEGINTEFVGRSDIEATISATGSVEAERTEQIAFGAAGEVVEVLVSEDDIIQFGQVLAKLDTDDLETSVRQAQAALQVSEAQLIKARTKPRADEIAAAEAAIESAKAQLWALYEGPTDEQRRLAKLAIDQAKNSLWGAQANRDAIKGNRIATGVTKGSGRVAGAQRRDRRHHRRDPAGPARRRAQVRGPVLGPGADRPGRVEPGAASLHALQGGYRPGPVPGRPGQAQSSEIAQ